MMKMDSFSSESVDENFAWSECNVIYNVFHTDRDSDSDYPEQKANFLSISTGRGRGQTRAGSRGQGR